MAEFGVPTNESYFAEEYLGYSVGVGIFWIIGTITPILCQEFWLKTSEFYKEEGGADIAIGWDPIDQEVFGVTYYVQVGLTKWT